MEKVLDMEQLEEVRSAVASHSLYFQGLRKVDTVDGFTFRHELRSLREDISFYSQEITVWNKQKS